MIAEATQGGKCRAGALESARQGPDRHQALDLQPAEAGNRGVKGSNLACVKTVLVRIVVDIDLEQNGELVAGFQGRAREFLRQRRAVD